MYLGIIILSVVAILFLFAVIHNVCNPPRVIQFNELPDDVIADLKMHFPEFQSAEVRFLPAVRKYKMKGSYKDQQVAIEVEMTKSGLIDELEFNDTDNKSSIRKAIIKDIDEIPELILKLAFSQLTQSSETPQFVRACHVQFSHEAGYKLELAQLGYHYEFEITESGRMIEFEKERS